MDLQYRILQAIGRLSGPRKEPVNSIDLAKTVGDVAPSSVALSNRFFTAVGWIGGDGRGQYTAADELVEYTRRIKTHDEAHAKGRAARPGQARLVLGDAGSAPCRRPDADEGRENPADAEAEAADSHIGKINNLIAWLKLIDLISVEGERITLAAMTAQDADGGPEEPKGDEPKHEDGHHGGASRTEVQEPTRNQDSNPPATVLAVSFDVRDHRR